MKHGKFALRALLAVTSSAVIFMTTVSAGWVSSGNKWWYQNPDGSYPRSGWSAISGKWYLFDKDGWMLTGWQQVGGKWYYLESSGAMKTGWVQTGGKWYYLDGSGAMRIGWVQTGGKWYYLESSGAMKTGWLDQGGKKYYLDASGAMVTGNRTIDGKSYTFDASGALKSGTPGSSAGSSSAIRLSPTSGGDWHFVCEMVNDTGKTLTLKAVEIADRYGTAEEKEPSYIPIDRLMTANRSPAAPGAKYVFDDWHPVVNSFNARRYTLIFNTSAGGEYRKDFFFELDKGPFLQVDPNAPLAPTNMGGELTWHFESYFTNTTGAELSLKTLTITDLKGGNKGDKAVIPVERLMNLKLSRVPAGGYFYHDDWHPVANIFDGRIYTYEFAKSTGGTFEYTTTFKLSDQMSSDNLGLPDYSGDSGKNVGPMNHSAGFEVPVAKDVYWVPAAHLGKSDLTNADIYSMLSSSPETKQQKVNTLYEALQLYRISGFFASDDNIRMQERGINWEHHKPGYYAVISNNGCCATDSNWLNYILKGDYEEVGFMAYSHTDGSGHIFNYIKSGGWYYFIDLTAHRAADSNCAFETGSMSDYYNSNSILGNIHKAKTPEAYVNYLRGSFGSNAPGLFFLYRASDCLAVDGIRDGAKTEIVYGLPSGVSVKVVYDNPSDKLTYSFTNPPSRLPDWSKTGQFRFP